MNKIIFGLLGIVLLSGCVSREQSAPSDIRDNSAAQAIKGEGEWWLERHQTILSRLDKNPELILIGNSIFHSLDHETRQEVWDTYLDQYQMAITILTSVHPRNWQGEYGRFVRSSKKNFLILRY